jgi:hypothetical protein
MCGLGGGGKVGNYRKLSAKQGSKFKNTVGATMIYRSIIAFDHRLYTSLFTMPSQTDLATLIGLIVPQLTERKRVADSHRGVGNGPAPALGTRQVPAEPALQERKRRKKERRKLVFSLRTLKNFRKGLLLQKRGALRSQHYMFAVGGGWARGG